jgi:elongation factor P
MLATASAALCFVMQPALRTSSVVAPNLRMGSTTDFKIGLTIEFEGAPWKITEFLHVKPGKGPAFVRSKMKNVQTGATLDKTWKAGETFPDAQVDKRELQYSYVDGDDYVFMDMESFEEERIPAAKIDAVEFIKEEMQLNVLFYKGTAIDVQVPSTMTLRVTDAQAAGAGAGKDKMSKMVELETGSMLSVPAFIKEGDLVKVDTVKREYLGRDAEGRNNA